MKFTRPIEVKMFLRDTIVLEASLRNVPLSEPEQYMLLWSEGDPDFQSNPALDEAFEEETDWQELGSEGGQISFFCVCRA